MPLPIPRAFWKGATIKEFPVPFLKRWRGMAKGSRHAVILRSIADIPSWWLRWVVLGRRAGKSKRRIIPVDEP